MQKKSKDNLIHPNLIKNRGFKREQIKVFLITVILYCTWHAARTAWAYSKKSVKDSNSFFNDQKLGVFDMCFMLAYAFGLFFNGWLGDQTNLKSFLALGSVISLSGYFIFALLARNEIFDMSVFAICFIFHGFGQSRGFPGNIAVLGNWIEPSKRGFLLGLWNASINIGNIIGQQIGRVVVDIHHIHWSNALFLAGGLMIIMSIIMFRFLYINPKDAGIEAVDEGGNIESPELKITPIIEKDKQKLLTFANAASQQEQTPSEGVKFLEAWKTPGLIKYSLVFACIKGSTYGLLFWLPDYLQSIMGFGKATSLITAAYELGQFIGAVVLGYYSDKIGKRSTVIVWALYISACLFIILAILGSNCGIFAFTLILFFAGVFFGGPEAIVGGVVSSDLGEDVTLKSDVRSMSTMAGIVDGTGSVGAAIVQMIIPYFKASSFYIYFGLCMISAFLMTPSGVKDLPNRKESKKNEGSNDIELQIKKNLKDPFI